MKHLILASSIFVCFAFSEQSRKLSNGTYRVHFTVGAYKDYTLYINDSSYRRDAVNFQSPAGRVFWLTKDLLQLNDPQEKQVDGPLKEIYNSWGPTCLELGKNHGDSLAFRTTYIGNLHITVNKGFIIKDRVRGVNLP